jgi:enamine deaminase RidA (YjgF/YER057c/UK114 family)
MTTMPRASATCGGLSHRGPSGGGGGVARRRRCALKQMVNQKSLQESAERRLAELGIELPPAPTPLGAYVESVQTGNLLYLNGVLPVAGREPKFVGRLGREYGIEQGREAARLAAVNVLSAARHHLGSLEKVAKVVKLTAYLAAENDFFAQPKVADAASELLCDVFGEDKPKDIAFR